MNESISDLTHKISMALNITRYFINKKAAEFSMMMILRWTMRNQKPSEVREISEKSKFG